MNKIAFYNGTDTCDIIKEYGNRCGRDFHGKAYAEKDKSGNWTGNWICTQCYLKKRDKKKRHEEYRDRYLTDRLTCNQDPNHSNAKGDLAEELTNRWKGTENLNEKIDNYISPIDHSPDPITGLVYQTKSRWYDPINKRWNHHWEREQNKKFDKLIFYCISEDGKIIERIYIFPTKEILKRTSITISKVVLRCHRWYEQYIVTDGETLNKVNEIWKEILEKQICQQHGII